MEVWSDLPGVQLSPSTSPTTAWWARMASPCSPTPALCLETQFYPDSVHHENFPFQYLQPGVPFSTTTEYRFSVNKHRKVWGRLGQRLGRPLSLLRLRKECSL